ncbi:MAG: divalent cation tolerance protein CutA [Euryarchaeota archaeon]|jgi:periplasmic divalent cation tolerance protein|nr:divalent cation tolerance protein CutA [Euryarchaeota archaeon]
MDNNLCSIKTTLPTTWREFEVVALAQDLLESGAACVQHHQITSTYRWDGSVQSEKEWSVEIKVSIPNKGPVIELLNKNHPYDVPQIICSLDNASDSYAEWINSQ